MTKQNEIKTKIQFGTFIDTQKSALFNRSVFHESVISENIVFWGYLAWYTLHFMKAILEGLMGGSRKTNKRL